MTRPYQNRGDLLAYVEAVVLADSDECQIWPFRSKTSTGYGLLKFRGKSTRATHVALILAGFPRPEGLLARHLCNVPLCVNPNHLRWGTPKENMDDRVAAGTNCVGEAHPAARLTANDVRQIRARLATGEYHRVIAEDFPVSVGMISRIAAGRAWTSVPNEEAA